MSNNDLIIKKIFPVEKFDFSKFSSDNCVSFTGSPMQHPSDNSKFLLICDPLSDHTDFIEFTKSDLVYIEELPSISTKNGENVIFSKIWIKIGAMALRFEPFIVARTKESFMKILSKK
jgi:hypothetical protein